MPVDIFHSRATDAVLRAMVSSSVAANMNMLRVWGGGMYYPDAFYDACDEMGVLVWQEAMFACSLYPADADFLDTVRPRGAATPAQALAAAAKRALVPLGRPLGCVWHECKACMRWQFCDAQPAVRGCTLCLCC